ncbi:MAG: T9SS C-terminal target domain-containing protein [Gemmatimonadetes bacterium]|nr:MAG: T9SS C-terminal target domain-containing protein [Gemmatimonadota bacterium]
MRLFTTSLIGFLMLSLLSSVAVAGVVTPHLRELLESTDESTYVPIIIELVDQVDVEALKAELDAEGVFTLDERRVRIVSALQEMAESTQPAFMPAVAAEEANGTVRGVYQMWLYNTVNMEAQPGAIERLSTHPSVAFIYYDEPLELIKPVHGEPAPPIPDGTEPGLRAIKADRVWYELGITGEGTIVGGIDSGVDGEHPALTESWYGNVPGVPWNQAWNGPGTFPHEENNGDGYGHGTHTMGIMCGVDPATHDTIGVAPGAMWIAGDMALNGDPDGQPGYLIMQWMAGLNNPPDVCNNSYGGGSCQTIYYPYIDNCENVGIVHITSAGNDGPNPSTVSSWADRTTSPLNAFSVGATSAFPPYGIAAFSSRGPSMCQPNPNSIKPEVSAPGVQIRSAFPGGSYVRYDGTSMSGPHVAGTVALMRQANPNMTVTQIKQALINSCIDLGDPGEDNDYGHGFIDAFVATARYAMGLPNLILLEYTLDDSDGNGNGRPEPGETVELVVSVFNVWEGDAINPLAELIINDEFITIDNGLVEYDDIEGDNFGDNAADPFVFTVSEDSPGGTIPITIHITTDENPLDYDLDFEIVVGYPQILLVDDDEGADYETYYRSAMDATDLRYEVWSTITQGVPGEEQFQHEIVVWFTGDEGNSLDADERQFLMDFMDQGGAVFITGQDIELVLEDGGEDFYHDYLKANLVEADRTGLVVLQPTDTEDCLSGEWGFLVAQGTGGPNNQSSPAVIEPVSNSGAIDILKYRHPSLIEIGGIKYFGDYNLIYLSFGFEAIYETPTGERPEDLMAQFIDWLADPCDTTSSVAVEQTSVNVPAQLSLEQNYPNPFNPMTRIHFDLPVDQHISLKIYDTSGQLVKTLVDAPHRAGRYTLTWNGVDEMNQPVNSGVYFYTLQAGEEVQTRQMVLLK